MSDSVLCKRCKEVLVVIGEAPKLGFYTIDHETYCASCSKYIQDKQDSWKPRRRAKSYYPGSPEMCKIEITQKRMKFFAYLKEHIKNTPSCTQCHTKFEIQPTSGGNYAFRMKMEDVWFAVCVDCADKVGLQSFGE